MVFFVVSQITQQLGHCEMWLSNSWRSTGSTLSSRKSANSRRKSLHVTKDLIPFPLKDPGQLFPQLEPRPQQPAFRRRHRKAQRLGRLLGGQFLHVAQDEHGPENRLQTGDGLVQNAPELSPGSRRLRWD